MIINFPCSIAKFALLDCIIRFFTISCNFKNCITTIAKITWFCLPHLYHSGCIDFVLQHISKNIYFKLSLDLPLLLIYDKHECFQKVTITHIVIIFYAMLGSSLHISIASPSNGSLILYFCSGMNNYTKVILLVFKLSMQLLKISLVLIVTFHNSS